MDTLPPELLSKILLYLPLMDRLESSLTCRRWAEAMTSSQLLHDVWLDIYENEMEAARSVLINTQRQYTRLVLSEANLTKFDSAFWGKIGKNLRVLELNAECYSWSADSFYAILQQCPRLESLKIVRSSSRISIDDYVPPEGTCQESLRNSLRHIRHLHLRVQLTADILDLLLGLMSNVTSIHLSYTFDTDSDFLERLPSILKKNRITHTEADFLSMSRRFTNGYVIKLIDGTSSTLRELRINAEQVTGAALDAIASCTRLRTLALWELSPQLFNSSDLEKLVSKLPLDLEILELRSSRSLKIEDMVQLVKFKKLRTLSLKSFSENIITNEFLCRVEEMSTLVSVDLHGFKVDSRVIRGLDCLENLRALTLRECPDSECFEAICENLGRLSELHLGYVRTLTDADGSKLCGFKDLRTLSFCEGSGFTDAIFEKGIGSRAMKHLHIHGCSLTDIGLMSIASYHTRLRTFLLRECKNITDAGIVVLLQNEPRLQDLRVFDCGFLRYEWRGVLEDFYPRLNFFDFGYTVNDSD